MNKECNDAELLLKIKTVWAFLRSVYYEYQGSQQSYTDITSPVQRPPKSLPKKVDILLLKGDLNLIELLIIRALIQL